MINPLAKARKSLGLTQEELAHRAGVSKVLIMRLEQGLLTKPTVSVLNALFRDPIEQAKALDDFDVWKVVVRKQNVGKLRAALVNWNGDWLVLRSGVADSKAGFCKLFCIHPQVLDNFESGIRDRRKLTGYLRSVFTDAGLTDEEILYIEQKLADFNFNGFGDDDGVDEDA